jgi:hypothetical protein
MTDLTPYSKGIIFDWSYIHWNIAVYGFLGSTINQPITLASSSLSVYPNGTILLQFYVFNEI